MDAHAERLLETDDYTEHLINKRVAEVRATIRAEARLVCDDKTRRLVDVFDGFEVLRATMQAAIGQPTPLSLSQPASSAIASVMPLSQPPSPRAPPAISASQSTASFSVIPVLVGAESCAQPDSEAKAPSLLQPTAPSFPLLDSLGTNILSAVDDGTNSIATTVTGTVPSACPGSWLDIGDSRHRISPVSVPGTTAAKAAAAADAAATMTAMERTLTTTTSHVAGLSAPMSPLSPENDLVDDPERAGHESVRLDEAQHRRILAASHLQAVINDAEAMQLAHNAALAAAPNANPADDGNETTQDTDDAATLSGCNEKAENEHGNEHQ